MGHDAGPDPLRRRREGRAANGRRTRARRKEHARAAGRATGNRRVLRRVAAVRSRARIREGSPPVSGVHARARGDDGSGDAAAARKSRVARRQFHGCLHCRVQLPQFRARGRLRPARAVGRVRARAVSSRIASRGTARPRVVPVVERRASGDIADRTRDFRQGTVSLSARAESAAWREHRSSGAHRRQAAGAAAAHAGARREPDVRDVSSSDGSDRLRPRELRCDRAVARQGSDRVREQQARHARQESGIADRRRGRDRGPRQRRLRRPEADWTPARREPRMPGMHRQAAVPLRVRANGNGRRPRHDTDGVYGVS